jgi:hypothetical protein
MLKGWPLVLVLTAAGPLVLQTLKFGHPEDLLATAAAVGAVLSARDGRPTAAGSSLSSPSSPSSGPCWRSAPHCSPPPPGTGASP